MRLFNLFIIFLILPATIQAQSFTLLELESAVIDFLQTDSDSDVQIFRNTWIIRSDDDMNVDYLKSIRNELKPFLGDLGIEGAPEGLIFYLSSPAGERKLKVDLRGNKITGMQVTIAEKGLQISEENIIAVFDSLENAGFAGLVFAEKQGEVVIEHPFGMAIPSLEIPNTVNTIFGTGSRPIDYTIAGIMLLDQRAKLNVDDPITEYFEDVPEDKHTLTLRHLMTGQSGFPDFIDVASDWNPDLQWINRQELEHRLLDVDLLFEPGSNRQHSHAAFGLLAAVIERVSGMNYYEFLNENFFIPAGKNYTGEYGTTLGYSLENFAEGGGPEIVGMPNIPPNWGPTSWLVKGSGGMFSTLDDLQKFYDLIRSGDILDEDHNQFFWNETVSLDGSMRGFELFTVSNPEESVSLYLFLNNIPDREGVRQVFRALEKFMLD